MELVEFGREHVDGAAEMAARGLRAARLRCAILPERWADPASYRPLLESMVEHGDGVCAVEGGTLLGLLTAWRGEGRGERWAHVPEWAWGTALGDGPTRRRLIEDLYAAAAARWVAEDRRTHYVGVHAHDADALAAWAWLGFGHAVMDGIRDLKPVAAEHGPGLTVRRGGASDAETIATLEDGLRAHLAASPVFFALDARRSAEDQERRLADDSVATLLAEEDGRALAYLRIGPAADDAATIIRDAGTASISGAFTVPDRRRGGVANALLAASVAWARDAGYERLAVDFETANILAFRFWTRDFTSVMHSLVRRV